MAPSAAPFFGSRGYLRSQNPAVRRIGHVVMAIEIAVLVWLGSTEGTVEVRWLALGLIGALILAGAVATSWPLGAVFTMVLASAMPRLAGSVFGLHLRPEHVAIGALLIAVSVHTARSKVNHHSKVRNFDYFLLAYVVLNFFTSAFTSPEPRMTLRWACLNAIVIAPFFSSAFCSPTSERHFGQWKCCCGWALLNQFWELFVFFQMWFFTLLSESPRISTASFREFTAASMRQIFSEVIAAVAPYYS